jgi:hypothetical protein
MGITARSRATLSLQATTKLEADDVLAIVAEAAGDVKGGGASLLTTGVRNFGAEVQVASRHAERLELVVTSTRGLVSLMTLTARTTRAEGRTSLTISIGTYKTQQSKFLMLVPTGPKYIHGMAPYKQFLETVERMLTARDPQVVVTIAQAARA